MDNPLLAADPLGHWQMAAIALLWVALLVFRRPALFPWLRKIPWLRESMDEFEEAHRRFKKAREDFWR